MAELRFDGKVAVVTGAGRGIGKEEAMFLARRGASVVVNDLGGSADGGGDSSSDPADEVVAEIIAAGGKAVASSSTIATPEGAQEIIDTAIKAFGRVDILVNNAGIVGSDHFPDIAPEDVQRQLSVHTLGYFHVTKAAWPHMVKQDYGRVIMTISTAGLFGMISELSYATAKGGVISFMRSLKQVAPDTIKVNAVSPAAFTRMVDSIKDENYRKFAESSRKATAVSPIVALLSHEDCPVSGEIFTAASGRVARVFTAETRGYFKTDHTPEDLVAHWDEVRSEDGYTIPDNAGDNIRLTLDRMREEGIDVPDALDLPDFNASK